ncbi:MAG TPA: UvrD-helicase domain-containing protein, partial [Balneolales bacterium]|nr:UvrD-helicase domain-containing protein [Balneolales bacterium]
ALKSSKGNIILRAGAGTGKTYNLTRRVMNLLTGNLDGEGKGNPCRVDEILALTFTNDAAGEMRERIYASITEELRGTDDPALRRHLHREKREFGRNFIMTFHAFCQRLLQYYPDEVASLSFPKTPDSDGNHPDEFAQLEAGFNLLDEYRQSVLQIEWHKQFYSMYKDLDSLHSQLANLGKRRFEIIIEKLAGLPVHVLQKVSVQGPNDYIDRLDQVRKTAARQTEEAFAPIHDYMEQHADYFKDPTLDPVTFASTCVTQKKEFRLSQLSNSKQTKDEVKAALDPLIPNLMTWIGIYDSLNTLFDGAEKSLLNRIEEYQKDDIFNADISDYFNLIELADVALRWSVFMRYCRVREKLITFDDVITLTEKLLDMHPEIAAEMQQRFRYILIDEFQDTDERQWKIVSRLARLDRGGNLMIVGDQKQAIYRFRGGDVTMIRRVEKELGGLDKSTLLELDLNHSFRSNHEVVAFSNDLFQHTFRDYREEDLFKARAQRLDLPPDNLQNKTFPNGLIRVMGYQKPNQEQSDSDLQVQELVDEKGHTLEALRIARLLDQIRNGQMSGYDDIRQLMNRGEKAVGILLRSRTHQPEIEEALRLYNIPFTVSSGRGFYRCQEIIDAANLLSFLLDSYDNVAVVGVLRSPFVGLSDAGLLALRLAMIHSRKDSDDRYSYWQAAQKTTQADGEQLLPPDRLALETMVPVLEDLRKASKYTRVSEILERVLNESNFWSAAADLEGVHQNMNKLIEIIRTLEFEGQGSLFDVVTFLRTQIDGNANEKEGERPDAGSVQIMTVHGSKGLEFPMVILPDMMSKGAGRAEVCVSPEDAWINGLPLFAYKDTDKNDYNNDSDQDASALYRYLKQLETERDDAETRRLFYVAVTRAAHHLVLSDTVTYNERRSNQSKISFGGYLDEWLNAGGAESELVIFDRSTFEELQDIASRIDSGAKKFPDQPSDEAMPLHSDTLTNAMSNGLIEGKAVTSGKEDIVFEGEAQLHLFGGGPGWGRLPANEAGTLVHKLVELDIDDGKQENRILVNEMTRLGYPPRRIDHGWEEDRMEILRQS